MKGDVWRLRGEQWFQDHWACDLQEVMVHCSKFRTTHYHRQFRLLHLSHQERLPRCLRRRRDCSTGSSNSPLERRWGCYSCALFQLLFSAGCCLFPKVRHPVLHLCFSFWWIIFKILISNLSQDFVHYAYLVTCRWWCSGIHLWWYEYTLRANNIRGEEYKWNFLFSSFWGGVEHKCNSSNTPTSTCCLF